MTSPQTQPLRRTARVRAKARPPVSDPALRDLLANLAESPSGAPPLPRAPSPLSRRFVQACAAVVGQVFVDEEVAQLEYGSLVFLQIEPGADQRRLSEWLGIDPSKTSLLVDRLESMGLIERRISKLDRRARELFATPKGEAVWRRILSEDQGSQRARHVGAERSRAQDISRPPDPHHRGKSVVHRAWRPRTGFRHRSIVRSSPCVVSCSCLCLR